MRLLGHQSGSSRVRQGWSNDELLPAFRPREAIARLGWCGQPGSNRHSACAPRDFKSLASTNSAMPASAHLYGSNRVRQGEYSRFRLRREPFIAGTTVQDGGGRAGMSTGLPTRANKLSLGRNITGTVAVGVFGNVRLAYLECTRAMFSLAARPVWSSPLPGPSRLQAELE